MVRLSQHIPTPMRIFRVEKLAGTNFRGKKFSRIFADLPKIREIPENFFPRKFLPAKISAFKVVVLRREQRSKEERCCQCKMNPITQEWVGNQKETFLYTHFSSTIMECWVLPHGGQKWNKFPDLSTVLFLYCFDRSYLKGSKSHGTIPHRVTERIPPIPNVTSPYRATEKYICITHPPTTV